MAYGEILPQAVLDLPAIAPVNLHFSLLPELRGASPVQTALLEGRVETGVTTIVMDAGMDTGPVILRRAEAIEPGDDAGSLGDRLASIGAEVLVETVDLFANGAVEPRPQDAAAATFTKLLGAEDRVLRWSEPARDLVNRTRAMAPEPGASARFRGEDLKIFRAEAVPAVGGAGHDRRREQAGVRRRDRRGRVPSDRARAGGPATDAGVRLRQRLPPGGRRAARMSRPVSGSRKRPTRKASTLGGRRGRPRTLGGRRRRRPVRSRST